MTITCTVCPIGCNISGKIENGEAVCLSGFNCARGSQFAKTEMTNPVRILTTVVKTEKNTLLPVRSDAPIPKEKIKNCMQIISKLIVNSEAKTHEIVLENILSTGANIIITK